jgi:hypothetical protein
MDELRKTAVNILGQAAAAPGSAGRLYEKAIEATSSGDFAEWKKRNADLLRSKPFQEAAQMYLRYLVLSLERGPSDRDSKRWAEPSLRYARDLAALLTGKDFRSAPGQSNELLREPIAKSLFTQWLQVGPLLPPDATWEQVPGNLSGILEKNVRAPWRSIGDPRTDLAWQLELETGVALADADGSERAARNFNQGTAPALIFRRAIDRAATGQPNRAAADVLGLVRRHPTHPDFPQWAAKLREMLGSKEETRLSPPQAKIRPAGPATGRRVGVTAKPTAAHHGGPQVCPNTVPVRDSHSAMPPQPSPHLATDQQTR